MSVVKFNIGHKKYVWNSDSNKESLEKFRCKQIIKFQLLEA